MEENDGITPRTSNFLLYLALLPVGGANHRDVDAVSRGGYILAIIVDGRRFLPATHLAMNCKRQAGVVARGPASTTPRGNSKFFGE